MLFPAFADFTIASEDATFALPNVHLGTSPILEVLTLAKTMSRSPVLRLALLGKHDSWTAERARQLGMVVEVTPRDKLDAKAAEILSGARVERQEPTVQLWPASSDRETPPSFDNQSVPPPYVIPSESTRATK